MGATDAQAQLTITGLLVGLGPRPADHRPALRRGRPPPAAAGRASGARPDVAALRRGSVDHPARRHPDPAGPGRRRRRRRGHGRRPRPVHRHPGRPAAVPADPGARHRAHPGALGRQLRAHHHLLARHLRRTCAGRGRPVAAGPARAAGDPAGRAPPDRLRTRFAPGLQSAVPRPAVRDDGAGGRTDVRHRLRLHRRRAVHPAGAVRPLRAAVRRGVQRQRRRDDRDDPAEPGAGAPLRADPGGLGRRRDRPGQRLGAAGQRAHRAPAVWPASWSRSRSCWRRPG